MSGTDETKPIDAKDKKLVNVILDDFGGITFALAAFDKTLSCASKLSQNKYYQMGVRSARYAVPAVLTTNKIYNSVKKWRNLKKEEHAHDKKVQIIAKVLGASENKIDDIAKDLDWHSCDLGKEILQWLLTKPKTEKFKLLGFYDIHGNPLATSPVGKVEFYVLFDFFDGEKVVLNLDITTVNDTFWIMGSTFYYRGKLWRKSAEMRDKIFEEFINHFDCSENVIYYDIRGLKVRRRLTCNHKIEQFDVPSFIKEIKSVLRKKKKRGYALVGKPGTGKSATLLKIEEQMRKNVIIYVSPASFKYMDEIKSFFAFIKSVKGCIAVFEDIDSYELVDKDQKLGEFLEQIDSIKGVDNLVLIATMNDTKRVHYSLINRPGRFDQVYWFTTPKNSQEVYNVLFEKMKKENIVKKNIVKIDTIDPKFFESVLHDQFSQADICEIIEKIIINDEIVSNKTLRDSLYSLQNTKIAIQECNFEGKDPNEVVEVGKELTDEEGIRA